MEEQVQTQQAQIQAQAQLIGQLQAAIQAMNVTANQNAQPAQAAGLPRFTKEHQSLIPTFNGNPEGLHHFLEVTQRLCTSFMSGDQADFQDFMVIEAIKAKILPPAAKFVFSSHINTYEKIKTALLNAYADKRDIFTLNIELTALKQGDNENPFKFHERILNHLTLITAYIENHEVDEADSMIAHYQHLALRCLLLNLREPLGSILRTRQPADLNTALSWMTNDYQLLCNNRYKPNPQTNRQNQNHSQSSQNRSLPQNNWQGPKPQRSNPPTTPAKHNTPHKNLPPKGHGPPSQQLPFKPPIQLPATKSNPNYPTPMSWQTTNPNLHNITEIGDRAEDYPPDDNPDMVESVSEVAQDAENDFLDDTSLDVQHSLYWQSMTNQLTNSLSSRHQAQT